METKFSLPTNSGHPSILGPQNSNIPKLVSVFVEVLASGLLESAERAPLGERIVATLRRVLGGCGEEARAAIWNGLNRDRQKYLKERFF